MTRLGGIIADAFRHPAETIDFAKWAVTGDSKYRERAELRSIAVIERSLNLKLRAFVGETAGLETEMANRAVHAQLPPPWVVGGGISLVQGRIYYAITRHLRPQRVVETGVAAGVSSAFLLHALHENRFGSLVSIDLPNQRQPHPYRGDPTGPVATVPDGLSPGWVVPSNLTERWKLVIGDSRKALPSVVEEGPIGLFVHDSLHTQELVRFELDLMCASNPNATFLVDDADLNSAFSDFCRERRLRWEVFPPRVLSLGSGRAGKLGIARPTLER